MSKRYSEENDSFLEYRLQSCGFDEMKWAGEYMRRCGYNVYERPETHEHFKIAREMFREAFERVRADERNKWTVVQIKGTP